MPKEERAEKAIRSAIAMGVETTITPNHIINAHPKLNLLFCA